LSIEVGPPDASAVMLCAVKAVRAIASGPPQRALAEFCWQLLRVLGVEPVVTHCIASGAEPSGRVAVHFSLREMGLLAPPHHEGRKDTVRVAAPVLRVLLSLARDEASTSHAV